MNIAACRSEDRSLKTTSRDSGTSSPQPSEHRPLNGIVAHCSTSPSSSSSSSSSSQSPDPKAKVSLNVEYFAGDSQSIQHSSSVEGDEELSDSNDSVFSSGSSIDSMFSYNNLVENSASGITSDLRDVYLGGSCMVRTKWRTEIAIPMLKAHDISYHLPTLHESIFYHNDDEDRGDVTNSLEATSNNDSGICIASGRRASPSIRLITGNMDHTMNGVTASVVRPSTRKNTFNLELLELSRVLLFAITNESRSLAPMTLAAHCIGLGYNVVLCIQMLPNNCVVGNDMVRNSDRFRFE